MKFRWSSGPALQPVPVPVHRGRVNRPATWMLFSTSPSVEQEMPSSSQPSPTLSWFPFSRRELLADVLMLALVTVALLVLHLTN